MAYDANKAQAARLLLENELVTELLDNIRRDEIEIIIRSDPDQVDLREYCYTMLKMVEVFRNRLIALASDAQHAKQSEEAKRMMS